MTKLKQEDKAVETEIDNQNLIGETQNLDITEGETIEKFREVNASLDELYSQLDALQQEEQHLETSLHKSILAEYGKNGIIVICNLN